MWAPGSPHRLINTSCPFKPACSAFCQCNGKSWLDWEQMLSLYIVLYTHMTTVWISGGTNLLFVVIPLRPTQVFSSPNLTCRCDVLETGGKSCPFSNKDLYFQKFLSVHKSWLVIPVQHCLTNEADRFSRGFIVKEELLNWRAHGRCISVSI